MSEVTLGDVEEAGKVLKGVARETPLDRSRTFSELTSSELYLKLENLQKTGSFKTRGAYVKISSLSEAERRKGVVAASAGNHAQGVAYSASLLGVKSTIVMPEQASPAKVDATKGYGASLLLSGRTFDDAMRRAQEISRKEGKVLIHAFDDTKVISGQGTVGLEMADEQPELDEVVIPVGGGGLASGIAVAMKAINPKMKIIGVQSEAYPPVYRALGQERGGKKIAPAETLADGIAVKEPGKITLKLLKRYLDGVVLVNDAEIAKAIFLLLERAKTLAEPAGAAGLAAVLSGAVDVRGKKCAVVISGGNIDMYTLDQMVAKGLEMEHRLLRLEFTLADRPGALREIIDAVADAKANVVDVAHQRMGSNVPLGRATVVLSLETQNRSHTKRLMAGLAGAGLRYRVLR
ncbi:MAG: threonine ammonia-lyase [Thaumarchaeota archaeon]|nr:MAG: threonine ammonia-lyase [Nitrososphaerota archaeon]